MYHNYTFAGINDALPVLMQDLLDANVVDSRNGRAREMTHVGITLTDPLQREIISDYRKPNIAAQIAETAWVLAGRNDIEFLSNYLPRAADYSDDGLTWRAGYGKRIRNWHGVDQLARVVEILNADSLSRQAVIGIWDPAEDLTAEPVRDRACNLLIAFSARDGFLDAHVSVRSNDILWGWSGVNVFEWSTLLEIVAGLTGNSVGALHFSTTSLHLYEPHWEKAVLIASEIPVRQELQPNPRFDARVVDHNLAMLDSYLGHWFQLEKMIRQGDSMGSLVDSFPEPMLQSWLRVLQWWWSGGDHQWLKPLGGTSLELATHLALQPTRELAVKRQSLIDWMTSLHVEKDAAYGPSWKRRGEVLGILANIARKIDRLESAVSTQDESLLDTAVDTAVYLAKYYVWLNDPEYSALSDSLASDTPHRANQVLREVSEDLPQDQSFLFLQTYLVTGFDHLEHLVESNADAVTKSEHVYLMLTAAMQMTLGLYAGAD